MSQSLENWTSQQMPMLLSGIINKNDWKVGAGSSLSLQDGVPLLSLSSKGGCLDQAGLDFLGLEVEMERRVSVSYLLNVCCTVGIRDTKQEREKRALSVACELREADSVLALRKL